MIEETQRINLGFVNAYLVKTAAGFILIDTGVAQQWMRLEGQLRQAGCQPGDLKLVIITHGDQDHAGNCATLQQKYGTPIAIHAGDLPRVKSGAPVNRHTHGLFNQVFLWLTKNMGGKVTCFQPDVLLEEGHELTEYGWAARVLHTPGHTPGSVAILSAAGNLFIGDTVSNRRKPTLTPLVENDHGLQQSLMRLKQTTAHTVYPGHGRPFPHALLASVVG